MDARCRSLDGSRIALSSAGFDVSGPVTSIAQVEMAGQIREVTAGSTPELLDHPEFHVLHVAADREYSLGDGRVVLGTGVAGSKESLAEDIRSNLTWAIWESQGRALFSHFYGDDDSVILKSLASLGPTIDEGELVLKPDPAIRFVETPQVALIDYAVGVMELRRLTKRVARKLPRWKGAPIPGGELYADRLGNGSSYLTLVLESCVAFIVTNAEVSADESVARVADLTASWIAA